MNEKNLNAIWDRWQSYGDMIHTIQITFSDVRLAQRASEWLRRRQAGVARRGNHVYIRPANVRMARDVMLAVGHSGEITIHPLTYFPK